MAATATSVAAAGSLTTTGTGYSGSSVIVIVSYTATNGRRNTVEMYTTPVSAGAISHALPIAFTSGTMVVKTVDTTGTVLATASSTAV